MSADKKTGKFRLVLKNISNDQTHRVISSHETREEAEVTMDRLQDSIAQQFYLEIEEK